MDDAGLHDEVRRVEDEPLEGGVRGAAAAEAPARQQARALAVPFEQQRPAAVDNAASLRLVDDKQMRRLDRGDEPAERLEARDRSVCPDETTDGQVLPLGMYLLGRIAAPTRCSMRS